MRDYVGRGPAGPLKNYHEGYLADPNGTRDTPLVPEGTVADIHIYIYIYIQIYIDQYRPRRP